MLHPYLSNDCLLLEDNLCLIVGRDFSGRERGSLGDDGFEGVIGEVHLGDLLIEGLLELGVLLDLILGSSSFHNLNHFFNYNGNSWGSLCSSGFLGFGFRSNKLECGAGDLGNEALFGIR